MDFLVPELISVRGKLTDKHFATRCQFYDYAITKIIKKISHAKDIDIKAMYAADLYSLYHWAMKHREVFAQNCERIKYIEPDSPYLSIYENSEYYDDLCNMAELHNKCLDRAIEKNRLNLNYDSIHIPGCFGWY